MKGPTATGGASAAGKAPAAVPCVATSGRRSAFTSLTDMGPCSRCQRCRG